MVRYTVFPIFMEQGLLIDDLKAATLARTSTGSGLFALLNNGFEQMLRQIVSIREKTLSNTNLEASRHVKKRIRFTSGSRASLKNVVAYKHPTDSGQTSCG